MLLLQCVPCLWQVFSFFWEVVLFPSMMCQCRPTGYVAMLFLGETATEQLGRSAQPCIFPALAAESRLPQAEPHTVTASRGGKVKPGTIRVRPTAG